VWGAGEGGAEVAGRGEQAATLRASEQGKAGGVLRRKRQGNATTCLARGYAHLQSTPVKQIWHGLRCLTWVGAGAGAGAGAGRRAA
jgi:hypothetical protein